MAAALFARAQHLLNPPPDMLRQDPTQRAPTFTPDQFPPTEAQTPPEPPKGPPTRSGNSQELEVANSEEQDMAFWAQTAGQFCSTCLHHFLCSIWSHCAFLLTLQSFCCSIGCRKPL